MLTSSVGYQSIRTTFRQPDFTGHGIPEDAEIILAYTILSDGRLFVGVSNNTDEIMIIDQTMSFFINNGQSVSYYDPTVTTTTNTEISSGTSGVSVNLGAVSGALGLGGAVGTFLSGVNVGGSETSGRSVQNMVVVADQPQVSIGPKGSCAMSKSFFIDNVGEDYLKSASPLAIYNEDNSCSKFSVCISYSLDGGNSFRKIVTDFYVNSKIVVPVTNKGKVNNSLRSLFSEKSDALNENLWLLHFNTNVPGASDSMVRGCLYDYQ